jgi:hypothetical protein
MAPGPPAQKGANVVAPATTHRQPNGAEYTMRHVAAQQPHWTPAMRGPCW